MATTSTFRTRVTAPTHNTCTITYEDAAGDVVTREFWAPAFGGAVFEGEGVRHGALGHQVCSALSHGGPTLEWAPQTEPLVALIRREYRALRRADAWLRNR